MTEESIFLDYVGDTPRMRVLQYFIEGRDFDYTHNCLERSPNALALWMKFECSWAVVSLLNAIERTQ